MIQGADSGIVAARGADRPIRLALFGAAPDTGNMGVSALFISAVTGIAQRVRGVEFVVFDVGLGERRERFFTPGGVAVPLVRFGARMGRRYHRPENLHTMALAAKLGRVGAKLNSAISLIDSCDAVLDVSGGDSFSDIYGRRRFVAMYLPKVIAKLRAKPLILLPQTYGPFKKPDIRDLAGKITCAADMTWSRDDESFAAMRGLLGGAYDGERHRSGVDMAFGLEPEPAEQALEEKLISWLKRRSDETPLAGFNVSGLIYNRPDGGVGDFDLKADYRQTVVRFLRHLLSSTGARVVLVPHVMDPRGHFESDLDACEDVARQLSQFSDRLLVGPASLNATQVKWLIAHMDWFCGTRMHSTIAGLSSGVPTASIAYSDKTRGVFRTCGQQDYVFDPRGMSADSIVPRLLETFIRRDEIRRSLSQALPTLRRALDSQFSLIAKRVVDLREEREGIIRSTQYSSPTQ